MLHFAVVTSSDLRHASVIHAATLPGLVASVVEVFDPESHYEGGQETEDDLDAFAEAMDLTIRYDTTRADETKPVATPVSQSLVASIDRNQAERTRILNAMLAQATLDPSLLDAKGTDPHGLLDRITSDSGTSVNYFTSLRSRDGMAEASGVARVGHFDDAEEQFTLRVPLDQLALALADAQEA